jgi:hypothetical protein
MKCPPNQDWDLLAMEALAEEQAASLLTHARECASCREIYAAARREHVDRVRMYEAFDRNHDELREQLLATLPAGAPRRTALDPLARGWGRLGEYAMTLNKTTGRRVAALLVPVAAALFVALFLFPSGQKSAFAAAIERLRQARTIVCRVTMPEGLEAQGVKLQVAGTLQFSDEFGSHSEMKMNDMVVTQHFAPLQGPMILVQPTMRTWMEYDPGEVAFMEMQEQSPAAFLSALRKLTDGTATELGPDSVGARAELRYRIPGEKFGFPPPRKAETEPAYAEMWVDIQTQLPTKLLLNMPLADEDKRLKVLYDGFEWNVPLEAGVFRPDIPQDYVQVDARLARPSEAALLNALKRIAELTDRYPASLAPGSVIGRLHTMVPKEKLPELDKLGREGLVRLGMEIAGGTMYHMKLARDGRTPEYFGDEVTPGDADKILMRWQLDDGQVRVIYGDLRIETLPAK